MEGQSALFEGTGSISFIEIQTPLLFLSQGPLAFPVKTALCPSLNSLWFAEFSVVNRPPLWTWGDSETHLGCMWALSPQDIWGEPQSSVPGTESCHPSSCSVYKLFSCSLTQLGIDFCAPWCHNYRSPMLRTPRSKGISCDQGKQHWVVGYDFHVDTSVISCQGTSRKEKNSASLWRWLPLIVKKI